MTFGLRNAEQTFQRFIDEVVKGLDFLFAYVDDILVASKTLEEHKNHINILFNRLTQYGINIRASKCQFGLQKLDFLSHEISKDGIKPSLDRINAIAEFPQPTSLKHVQRFVGMVNYYHRFFPNLADKLASIYEIMNKLVKQGKKHIFEWPIECQNDFDKIKKDLINCSLLTHPIKNEEYCLETDASGTA